MRATRAIQVKRTTLCAAACCGVAASVASTGLAQTLAFPEAEGFGRFATGPRASLSSASVYHVTNLNDSGAGSLRDALSQPNRYVVFDVGGIINLSSVVTVASNVYIAGQTAPGGIGVYNNRVAFHGANNLISRYWSVRLGTSQGRADAASLVRGQNMIWDHMSITWGVDGTFDINPDPGQVIDNLTIQNTAIAQGLDVVGHSTGGLMTIGEGNRFSLIKNLFADNVTRNPKARGDNEFINNVVYGYQTSGYIMGDTTAVSNANAIGNYFIEGPVDGSSPFASGTSSFNIYGNDNWVDSNRDGVLNGSQTSSYPGANVVATPHAFPTTTAMTAQQAVQFVAENFGPNITRDAVDTRLAAEVLSYGTLGGVIVRDSDLFPNYGTDPSYLNPRARLLDTDNDGMPDSWETSRGLNPSSNADWKGLNAAGYTRLEEYLNELGGYGVTRTIALGGAWTNAGNWGGSAPDFATTAVATNGFSHASGNAFARQLRLDGAATVSGGTLDVFDTALVGSAGTGSLTVSGGTVSAGRVVLGATGRTGSLALNGGTLQTGTVTSGGGTASLTFNGGTFRATAAPNISVPTTVAAGGGTIHTNGFSGSITGGLSGGGTLAKIGTGTLTLGGNNAAFSGPISLNAGTLVLATSAANSSTGTITAANGTTLQVTTSGASTPLAIASGATVTLTAGGLTYNGAISGPTGTTLLISTAAAGTSNFSVNGSLAGFNGAVDLGTSTGNVRIGSAGGATAAFNLGTSTGTIRTTFDSTVNFGSLSGGANTRLQGSTNGTAGSTYVIGALGTTTTFAGTITDGTNTTPAPLSITKTGNGTLTLTGANLYTGATSVNAGRLQVNGSIGGSGVTVAGGRLGGTGADNAPLPAAAGGTVAPGSFGAPGTLTVNGPVALLSGSATSIDVASAASASRLSSNGAVDLGGSLAVNLLNSYKPARTDTFTVLTGASVTGTFANLNPFGLISTTDNGWAFTAAYTGTAVTLSQPVQRGDVNLDGAVNNLDIAPFVAALTGAAPTGQVAFAVDASRDGLVNNLDIAPFVSLLTSSTGLSTAQVYGLLGIVPEPTSLSLLGLAGLCLRRRRR
jgi:autotransporter-associated beta strand protein